MKPSDMTIAISPIATHEEDPDEPVELGLQRRSPPRRDRSSRPRSGRARSWAGCDHDALASPADDARAAVGDRPPIGQVAVAASGSVRPCSGIDSPVSTLRSSCRRSTRISRRSAGTTSPPDSRTTSPGTRLAAMTCDDRPVAPDAGHRCAGIAQRLERPLAAVLGDDVRADDRDQADEHEQPVADLAEQHGTGARREEQQHERLRGRLDDEPPHARPLRRLQLVGPDPGGAPRSFGGSSPVGGSTASRSATAVAGRACASGSEYAWDARGHVLMIRDQRRFATCRPARSNWPGGDAPGDGGSAIGPR